MKECKICEKEYKNDRGLSSHIYKIHKISSNEYYDKYLKKYDEGICLECGKETKFIKKSKGYSKYCSLKCSNNSYNKKEKYKQTCLEKYGVENVMYHKIIKEKIEKTNIEKYGFECSLKNENIKEKIKKTNIEKYGFENPLLLYSINKKTQVERKSKFLIYIFKVLNYFNLKLLDNEYVNSQYKHNWKCSKCGYEFIQTWNNIQQGYICTECYPRNNGCSKGEKELSHFIKSLNLEIIENDRIILDGKELDIFIPSKNVAIEYNGLYWHSEKNGEKNRNYHLNKTEFCEKQNIRLVHIFEDEWIFKQNIVKSRLKQILGISDSKRIHARKCKIKEIDSKIKNEFLNKYHIQGIDNSSIKLGAFYNFQLVSVMTFSKGNISKGSKNIEGIYELSRFCSNSIYHIPGIASKLLSYFKRNYEWREIFSYADRRWSQGNVYKQIGFELESITKPNYFYIINMTRVHRYNFRKRKDEPKNVTEWILRQQEGFDRIWDSGHYKFRMDK